MRKRLLLLPCFVACSICVHGQTQTRTEVTGSVSGHVFCADTNQPARFAMVLLQPPPHKFTPNEEPTPSPTARTALDGSFHLPKSNREPTIFSPNTPATSLPSRKSHPSVWTTPVAQTDDKGYFRISGLPAGKYVAETTFPTTSVSYGG